MSRAALIALLVIPLLGCGDYELVKKDTLPQPKPAERKKPTPTHRFVLVQRLTAVAFDTQTGQLCRTWDWVPVAPEAPRERQPGELTPTCLSLYQKYPTQTDPSDPLEVFQDSN